RRDARCRRRQPRPIRLSLNSSCIRFRKPCLTTRRWWRKPHHTVRQCKISCRCADRTVFTPWQAAASDIACPLRGAWRSAARSAQGLGCDAVRVTKSSELAPALQHGLAHDGVSLIEVVVDSAVPLLYTQKG